MTGLFIHSQELYWPVVQQTYLLKMALIYISGLYLSARNYILNLFYDKCLWSWINCSHWKKKDNTFRWYTVCLSTSLSQSFGETHVSLKAFMPFQKLQSSCCLQSKSSLNCEVSGRERWFRVGAKTRDRPGARALWNTQTHSCVWTASHCSCRSTTTAH